MSFNTHSTLWELQRGSYDFVVTRMVGLIFAVFAEVALLQVKSQLDLACAEDSTLRAEKRQGARLIVLVELRLALKDALAAFALEVVLLKVFGECRLVWPVKVATWL